VDGRSRPLGSVAAADLVVDAPDLIEGAPGWVGQLPAHVTLARNPKYGQVRVDRSQKLAESSGLQRPRGTRSLGRGRWIDSGDTMRTGFLFPALTVTFGLAGQG
jgi:hypothetical protein